MPLLTRTKKTTTAPTEAARKEEDWLARVAEAAQANISAKLTPYREMVRRAAADEELSQDDTNAAVAALEAFGLPPTEFLADVKVFKLGMLAQRELEQSEGKAAAAEKERIAETTIIKRLKQELLEACGRYNTAEHAAKMTAAGIANARLLLAANPRLFGDPAVAVERGISSPAMTHYDVQMSLARPW